jgi:SAM-dependent methyltransferase
VDPTGEHVTNSSDRERAYFAGEVLYGDDLGGAELEEWFADERNGYFDLYGGGVSSDTYGYSELARQHAFRWLPPLENSDVLGIGSADGTEIVPLVHLARSVTIIEPAEGFARTQIAGKPVRYIKPQVSGLLPFPDRSFDLTVCFSVLHHIPNVSTVIVEMARVTRPGGHVLLREPTVSMGDWRLPRRGLTKRERGIPRELFREIVRKAGFEIVRETPCMFSATSRLNRLTRRGVWASPFLTWLDACVCALPIWSSRYHTTKIWHRFRPTALALVLRKPE